MKDFFKYIITICFFVSFNKCTKNIDKEDFVLRYFHIQVHITRDSMFSDRIIDNPTDTDRKTPTKYRVVYEDLDDVGVKVMHINETIGGTNIYFKIRPYGKEYTKHKELLKNHTQRKFRFTLYEEDKVLLSKVITTTPETWNSYRELKLDNMDYLVNKIDLTNGLVGLEFNLSKKN